MDNATQVRTARAIIGPGKRSSAAALHQLDPLHDGFLSSASSVSLSQPAKGQSFLTRKGPYRVRTERTDVCSQANSCRSASSRSHSAPSRSDSSLRTHAATPSPSSSFTYRPPRSRRSNSKTGSPSERSSVHSRAASCPPSRIKSRLTLLIPQSCRHQRTALPLSQ